MNFTEAHWAIAADDADGIVRIRSDLYGRSDEQRVRFNTALRIACNVLPADVFKAASRNIKRLKNDPEVYFARLALAFGHAAKDFITGPYPASLLRQNAHAANALEDISQLVGQGFRWSSDETFNWGAFYDECVDFSNHWERQYLSFGRIDNDVSDAEKAAIAHCFGPNSIPMHFRLPPYYPFRSSHFPGKVAAYLSNADLDRNKLTAMKPGRFLTRFTGNILNGHEVEQIAADISAVDSGYQLTICGDPEEIVRIYERCGREECGAESCMGYRAEHWRSTNGGIHPASVYGLPGDLSLAYVEYRGRVRARALCWQEKKIYGRVYGDHARLTSLLHNLGYRRAQLTGARIRIIVANKSLEEDGESTRLVMPYIDGDTQRVEIGEHFAYVHHCPDPGIEVQAVQSNQRGAVLVRRPVECGCGKKTLAPLRVFSGGDFVTADKVLCPSCAKREEANIVTCHVSNKHIWIQESIPVTKRSLRIRDFSSATLSGGHFARMKAELACTRERTAYVHKIYSDKTYVSAHSGKTFLLNDVVKVSVGGEIWSAYDAIEHGEYCPLTRTVFKQGQAPRLDEPDSTMVQMIEQAATILANRNVLPAWVRAAWFNTGSCELILNGEGQVITIPIAIKETTNAEELSRLIAASTETREVDAAE